MGGGGVEKQQHAHTNIHTYTALLSLSVCLPVLAKERADQPIEVMIFRCGVMEWNGSTQTHSVCVCR